MSQTHVFPAIVWRHYLNPILNTYSETTLRTRVSDACVSSNCLKTLSKPYPQHLVWSYLKDTSASDACVSSNCLKTPSKPYPQHQLWSYLRDTSVSDACVSSNCLKTLSKPYPQHLLWSVLRDTSVSDACISSNYLKTLSRNPIKSSFNQFYSHQWMKQPGQYALLQICTILEL
jgi:ribosomal protein L28